MKKGEGGRGVEGGGEGFESSGAVSISPKKSERSWILCWINRSRNESRVNEIDKGLPCRLQEKKERLWRSLETRREVGLEKGRKKEKWGWNEETLWSLFVLPFLDRVSVSFSWVPARGGRFFVLSAEIFQICWKKQAASRYRFIHARKVVRGRVVEGTRDVLGSFF